jgi:hypothetical protein
MLGREKISLTLAIFNARKSTHNLISPFFFHTWTNLYTHLEYRIGKIIWELISFSTSFLIVASKERLIGMCLFLTVFASSLVGIAC